MVRARASDARDDASATRPTSRVVCDFEMTTNDGIWTTARRERDDARGGSRSRTDDDDGLDAQDGTEVHFKVRPTTKFSKVFEGVSSEKIAADERRLIFSER